jgi:hypothetical protein
MQKTKKEVKYMSERDRLEKAANLYITARKALKKIDKKKEPERYERCCDLIGISAMILQRHGVTITL